MSGKYIGTYIKYNQTYLMDIQTITDINIS